jgi:hypothetical protein
LLLKLAYLIDNKTIIEDVEETGERKVWKLTCTWVAFAGSRSPSQWASSWSCYRNGSRVYLRTLHKGLEGE